MDRIAPTEGGHRVPVGGLVSANRSRVVGFGDEEILAPTTAKKTAKNGPSAWTELLATTVVGAAAGWAIEEIATMVRGRRRR